MYKARRIKTKIPRITLRMIAVIKKKETLILVIKSRNDTFPSELKSTRELQSKNNLRDQHNVSPNDFVQNLKILRKCQSKLDCLIFEILFFIKELKPILNKQCDSIRSKLFV